MGRAIQCDKHTAECSAGKLEPALGGRGTGGEKKHGENNIWQELSSGGGVVHCVDGLKVENSSDDQSKTCP